MTRYLEVLKEVGNATLVVVSKSIEAKNVKEVYDQGCRDFGESYVQEALEKMPLLPHDCRWHLIGRLQKNKVAKVIGRFYLIHSVDSVELAEKIGEESEKRGCVTSILLQANTSNEKTKAGLSPEEWKNVFPALQKFKGLALKGWMTMAPLTEEKETIRWCFRKLKQLRDETDPTLSILSMGMSHDYSLALEEGSTLVRLGSAIFKEL